jgi:hypothetical protein
MIRSCYLGFLEISSSSLPPQVANTAIMTTFLYLLLWLYFSLQMRCRYNNTSQNKAVNVTGEIVISFNILRKHQQVNSDLRQSKGAITFLGLLI